MSTSPLAFVALYVLAGIGAFLLGLRFTRAKAANGDVTVEQARRFGRLLMMAATAMLLFLVAIWAHGDLKLSLQR